MYTLSLNSHTLPLTRNQYTKAFRRVKRVLLALCILTTISACVSIRPSPPSSTTELDHWKVEGKIALKLPNQAQSAFFNWHNHGDNYTIKIYGPFGQGGAELVKNGDTVSLNSKKTNQRASSPEALLEQNLGWSLPVSELRYWVRGLPSPDSPSSAFTPGTTTTLEQKGWKITYKRFATQGGLILPEKIVAQHEKVKLTILIKAWKTYRK